MTGDDDECKSSCVTGDQCCALSEEDRLYDEDHTFTCHSIEAHKYSPQRLRSAESSAVLCFGVILFILFCIGFYKLYRQNKAIIMLLKTSPHIEGVSIRNLRKEKEKTDGKDRHKEEESKKQDVTRKDRFFDNNKTLNDKTDLCEKENGAYGQDTPNKDLQPTTTDDKEEESKKQDVNSPV